MKIVLITVSLLFLALTGTAQTSFTNGAGSPASTAPSALPPGNQAQPQGLNNGSTPLGQPNSTGGYNPALPNPSSTPPSSTGSNPTPPGVVSPAVPNPPAYPSSQPLTPVPTGSPNQLNFLFQSNPVRTPKTPKQSGPVATVDGSTGKYKSMHHTVPAKKNGFATNRRTKGVKSHVSRERKSSN